MKYTKILGFMMIVLVSVCMVSALKVWNAGYDEYTDTYVVAVFNDGLAPLENLEIRIDAGEYILLKHELPIKARVNYRIEGSGKHDFFLKANNMVEEHYPLTLSQEIVLEPTYAQTLYTLQQQEDELQELRKLKAKEREDEIALLAVKQSSQTQLITPSEQEFDMNALFIKIIIILFVVVGALALYEYVIVRTQEGRK